MEKCKYVDNAQAQTEETRNNIDADCAFDLLKKGNERFVENSSLNRNLKEQRETTSRGQFPFAAILSCIDSRVSSELIFDQGIGDIFNIRVAGNFVNSTPDENENILAALEFAATLNKEKGVKLILVLGHTGCGAVESAFKCKEEVCDVIEQGVKYTLQEKDKLKPQFITPMLKRLRSNLKTKEVTMSPDLGKATEDNVINTIKHIRDLSPFLKKAEICKKIQIRGGIYDIRTGEVTFLKDEICDTIPKSV
jgi:carbonic anhydrase